MILLTKLMFQSGMQQSTTTHNCNFYRYIYNLSITSWSLTCFTSIVSPTTLTHIPTHIVSHSNRPIYPNTTATLGNTTVPPPSFPHQYQSPCMSFQTHQFTILPPIVNIPHYLSFNIPNNNPHLEPQSWSLLYLIVHTP